MAEPTPDQHLALRSVAERYAAGVDRRDAGLFLSAFATDGCLQVFNPTGTDQPGRLMEGHEQLARVIPAITRFDATFHQIANTRYDVDGRTATGEVYCAARHLTRSTDGDTDHVMFIRYADTYTTTGDGWVLTDRKVQVDWTETRPTNG